MIVRRAATLKNKTTTRVPTQTVTHTPSTTIHKNRGLTRIDLKTGTESWLLPIDAAFTPAVSPDGEIAYVLSTKDKALRAVRVDDGKVVM